MTVPPDRKAAIWMRQVARGILPAIGVAYILMFCILTIFRMQYPFELERMEGGMVEHVHRVRAGQPLYVSPSVEFVPFIYPPFYYYVSAAVSVLTGEGFLPLRLVSFACALGCFTLIFLIIKRETGETASGLIACGLFAATFRVGGAWFDVARIDTLSLLLVLAGVYVVRFRTSRRSVVVASALFALAFQTRQSCLLIAVAIAFYLLWRERTKAFLFIGVTAALCLSSVCWLNYRSEGWYCYYVFFLPQQHDLLLPALWGFWLWDILWLFPVACALAVYYVSSKANAPQSEFYLCLAYGMFGTAYLGRIHLGGYANVLMPAHAMLALLFGLALPKALTAVRQARPAWQFALRGIIYAFGLWQFARLIYTPTEQVPTPRDLAAGHSLVRKLAAIPGDVFVPDHGYLAVMAGKKSFAHKFAMFDVMRSKNNDTVSELLREDIRRSVGEEQFGAVVLDDTQWAPPGMDAHYIPSRMILIETDDFWPVTGGRTRPSMLYVLAPKRRDRP